MAQAMIPFLDLVTPHVEMEEELVEVFRDCLRSAHFVGGKMVEDFEQAFARFCEANFCVGVANGTDAVRFALMGAGIEPGDACITQVNTFIATSEAISQAGARPLFVDIDERTYNLDTAKLAKFLERDCKRDASGKLIHAKSGFRVRAIVPVHLYGQMADMDRILELAYQYDLLVIEDSCQAHGAKYYSAKDKKWHTAGSMGVAAAFSFYPGKNLGACGEGGAVATKDEAIAKKIRMIREHGSVKKYYHDMEGYNGRLHTIQAGFLSVKLKHLPEWTAKRQAVAKEYGRQLEGVSEVMAPFEPSWSKAVYHLYVVRVQNREKLQADLSAAGVATAIHYPIPLHQQKAYAHLGYKTGDFPVAERVAPEIVSLPMFPQLTMEQVHRVAEKVIELAGAQKPVAVTAK
jgi:dTDP-4-amino-4,6-dideoxygalactose transaminase